MEKERRSGDPVVREIFELIRGIEKGMSELVTEIKLLKAKKVYVEELSLSFKSGLAALVVMLTLALSTLGTCVALWRVILM